MKKLTLALACLVSTAPLLANTADQDKGYSIAEKMVFSDTGWVDQTSEMNMILISPSGSKVQRKLVVNTLEIEGDGDKAIAIFKSPSDVKGTVFLSHTHVRESDDQWLYLPALKRTKRISNKSKSGAFMGSEYSYEDLTSNEIQKYEYKWLEDDVLDGKEAHVLERYPKYSGTKYSKQKIWVESEHFYLMKTEFYINNDLLLKTNTMHDFKLYEDKYWRPERMTMVNHVNGKSTQLEWENIELNTGLNPRDFNKKRMEKVRF